jgi:hypothetical protein
MGLGIIIKIVNSSIHEIQLNKKKTNNNGRGEIKHE